MAITPITQTHFTSNSISTAAFFTGRNQPFKPNSVHFVRTKPPPLLIRAAKTDHYKTLNLNKNATLKQIKASYRELALKYHPDVNKDSKAAEKFKQITAAYEVLSDEKKRSAYDRAQGGSDSSAAASTWEMHVQYGGSDGYLYRTGSHSYEIRIDDDKPIIIDFSSVETRSESTSKTKKDASVGGGSSGEGIKSSTGNDGSAAGGNSDQSTKPTSVSGGSRSLGSLMATIGKVLILICVAMVPVTGGNISVESTITESGTQEEAYKSGTSATK